MQTTISIKINVIVLLVVLCLGCAVGGLSILDQRAALRQELDRRIQLLGAHMAEEFIEAGVEQPDILSGMLQATALDPEICYVMIKSPDGEILASRWAAQQRGAVREYDFPLLVP